MVWTELPLPVVAAFRGVNYRGLFLINNLAVSVEETVVTIINPIQPNIQPVPVQAGFTPRESLEQQLRIDQVVRATVSEGGEERVWLNIGRQRFLAETEIPLRTGVGLTLMVSKTAPRLEFKVVNDPLGSLLRQNLHLLELPWSLEGVVASLGDSDSIPDILALWNKFLALQEAVVDQQAPGSLARLLAFLGMDYEARLAQGDSTGILTTLKKLLQDARKSGDGIKDQDLERLERFSGLFELWQMVRLKQSLQSVEFWPLMLPWLQQGFLLAERGEGGGSESAEEGERPWRITLHLQLPQLGALQIDFLFEQTGLFLRFKCENPTQAGLLSAAQDELRNSVLAVPLEGVAFSLGAQPPAALLARLIAGEGVVDERV